jgi:TIR domain-containing protein
MPFEYGCFVSYAHPEGRMMRTFIEDLVIALESELDPYMKQQVYFDQERLKPGYEYDLALSHGLCSSACWILVYVPQYREREYCLREYHAMEMLEEQRRRKLGDKLPRHRRMIVPILVRGVLDELPGSLAKSQCLKFDRLTLAEATISDRPEAMAQVSDLATEIHEIHKLGSELDHDCDAFEMPEPQGDLGFRRVDPPFPGDPRPTVDGRP